MLEFNILKGQYLNRLDKNIVSADTTDLKAQFDLTSDFTGTITVWWRRSDANNTYTSTLAADGTCTIPAEALVTTDKAVYGPYDHDVFVSISDTGRTTTNEYKLTVLRSAFSTDATPGTGGSPTAYEELVEQFDELKADNQTFKDSMTEQQETFESTVTENVDNIRYVVETETAPPIIEEASGAEITLDDSAYRQVRDLQLYGYSKQTQTTGANLIETIDGQTNNGISATLDDDGYIVLNGTATSNAFLVSNCYVDAETQVFLSAGNPTGNSAVLLYFLYNATETAFHVSLSAPNVTAFTATQSRAWMRFNVKILKGTSLTNFRLRPMLNSGTSALPWQPYSAPSSALITLTDSLRGIPVSSGGNYTDESGQQWIADYIYRRQADGKWMLWRNCASQHLSKNGDYIMQQENIVRAYTHETSIDGSVMLCEKFGNGAYGAENKCTMGYIGKQMYFSGVSSVDRFNEILGDSGMEVVYQIATPTIEELPENVQTELNGLYTYNLHTDMWNSDGAYMGLKYVADTKTWINNKIAGLSTAMLNQN